MKKKLAFFIAVLYNKSCVTENRIMYALLAQLVEQRTENPRVSGSIPELGTFNCIENILV